MDTDSIWYERNEWWGKQIRKKFKKLKFPSIRKKKTVIWNPIEDDFKGGLFRELGELLTPIVEDYPREFEQPRCYCGCSMVITGHCCVCNHQLTEEFPDDYPKDWMFCCNCLGLAKLIAKGYFLEPSWTDRSIGKIRNKITLWENDA